MADSDHTTTLSIVTRTKANGERVAIALSPKNPEAGSDPAADVWGKWRAAQEEVDRLCRLQQRLERNVSAGAVGLGEYTEALLAENLAGEQALDMLVRLSQTPAASLVGIAAKLDAVLGEAQPSEDDDEFPWPLIRSALADLIRIGRLGVPMGGSAAAARTRAGNSA
ncbi:MAG: hypothetical protein IKE42_14590 [Aquamicrobium sp.]|uniref:hypothetical protein n=1 Tax=Mesorhizobium sp. Pch-S TaxID=2082387 RepID=UPI001012E615|nr:hypothetical protein [Mesorhizobium sp. Pch-S]MBR2689076.1 hypothetical protein [Aquamicrobium sp.]QAZ44185.1 hypothetical protein C1M53_15775 [Mesorhizobium sp. Pch-S]